MTEDEWLACADPAPMLDFLKGSASDRKLRLTACALARHILTSHDPQRCRKAIDTAERYADGLASETELRRAWMLASQASSECEHRVTRGKLVNRDGPTREEIRPGVAAETAYPHTPFLIGRLKRVCGDIETITVAPSTLRDIIGNPFRPVAFDPAWRTPTAATLARQMYDTRDFAAMPILADALQDAGCDHPDVVAHCRGPGPHARGCWVVDLVLGYL